ncbi:MAG: DUF5076 domain-containing protein [Planctomycetota bacterium]
MPARSNELAIPPDTEGDPKAFEILRVWAAGKKQHVTIRSNLEGGASGFGFMLAQLARHGANLYAQREGMPKSEALSAILEAFKDEIDGNTGEAEGRIPD